MSEVDNTRPRLRALIYNRSSADKGGQRVSVESQDHENRAFCARQGWDIVATVTDNDRSASRWAAREREGYKQVHTGLVDGRWGRIDVLVAWESSRAQRNLADFVAFRELCEQHNILFAYRGRVYDLTHGDDRFSTGLDALLDEREAERARERTLRSHRASVNALRPRGTAPYGYTRTYTAGGRLDKQVPDPETAPVVRMIARRVLAGETLYSIAQSLNRDGVLPPRASQRQRAGRELGQHGGWSPTILRNLLANPSLAGMRTYKGKIVGENAWEPILDPADWARVQALLRDPARPTARDRTATYLLSGIAECGVCGAWMRPLLNRGRMTYACAGLNPTAQKGHVARSLEKLDAYVQARVVGRLRDPELAAQVAAAEPGGVGDRAAEAVAEISGLRSRLQEFEELAVAGRVSADAFARMETRLLAQIAELEESSRRAVLPPVVAEVAGPDAAEKWRALGLMQRRTVVRALCRVVVHRSTRPGARVFDPSTVQITWRRRRG